MMEYAPTMRKVKWTWDSPGLGTLDSLIAWALLVELVIVALAVDSTRISEEINGAASQGAANVPRAKTQWKACIKIAPSHPQISRAVTF